MAIKGEKYHLIEVESYLPKSTSGLHGKVHIRPVPGQADFDTSLHVQCSSELKTDFPVGTKFRNKAKLNDLKGGGKFIYNRYGWPYEVTSIGHGPIIKD
jgi:hypothetical protein